MIVYLDLTTLASLYPLYPQLSTLLPYSSLQRYNNRYRLAVVTHVCGCLRSVIVVGLNGSLWIRREKGDRLFHRVNIGKHQVIACLAVRDGIYICTREKQVYQLIDKEETGVELIYVCSNVVQYQVRNLTQVTFVYSDNSSGLAALTPLSELQAISRLSCCSDKPDLLTVRENLALHLDGSVVELYTPSGAGYRYWLGNNYKQKVKRMLGLQREWLDRVL